MRASEFASGTASGQQVLDYINSVHHEGLTDDISKAVLSHPRWQLTRVPLSQLQIPDQSYDDDPDYEPPEDPYGRVMDVDPEHAGEYSVNFVDRRPIVVDADGFIIDGNHRAWAAAELLNRDSIRAWVPANIKEVADPGARRTAELLVRELEAELAEFYDTTRGTVPPAYKDQVRRRIEALNQELQTLGFKYAPTAPGRVAPFGSRFVEGQHASGWEMIQFSYVNPRYPEGPDPDLEAMLVKGLRSIPGVVVRGTEDQAVRALYQTREQRRAIRVLAYRLGIQIISDDPITDAEAHTQLGENFADGKVKGKSRPGRVKRAGASCAGSVSDLRAKASKYGGERGKMYHWCANMKSGKKNK